MCVCKCVTKLPAACISSSVLVGESFFKEALSPLLILRIPSEFAFLLSQLLEVV